MAVHAPRRGRVIARRRCRHIVAPRGVHVGGIIRGGARGLRAAFVRARARWRRRAGHRSRAARALGVTRQRPRQDACAACSIDGLEDASATRTSAVDLPSWMARYLVRRLLLTIPVLLGVATLVFALIHLVPGRSGAGDAGRGRVGGGSRRSCAHALGLDRPLLDAVRSLHGRPRPRRSRDVVPLRHAGHARDPRAAVPTRAAGAGGDGRGDR